jgi:hypothetical protein
MQHYMMFLTLFALVALLATSLLCTMAMDADTLAKWDKVLAALPLLESLCQSNLTDVLTQFKQVSNALAALKTSCQGSSSMLSQWDTGLKALQALRLECVGSPLSAHQERRSLLWQAAIELLSMC